MSDSVTAIVAGSDTTAAVLSSIMYCLLSNPSAYERLLAEVDGFSLSGEDRVDAVHLPELHYLEAVM